MSEQNESQRAPQGEQTYVVQMLKPVEVVTGRTEDPGSARGELLETMAVYYWDDIAEITVPPRTKRSVVIKKALAEAGIKPGQGDPPKCRALDAESAVVHEPKPRQIEPEWVL